MNLTQEQQVTLDYARQQKSNALMCQMVEVVESLMTAPLVVVSDNTPEKDAKYWRGYEHGYNQCKADISAQVAPQATPSDDSKALAEVYDSALDMAAMYVENHCVDGEMHANAILTSKRPDIRENGVAIPWPQATVEPLTDERILQQWGISDKTSLSKLDTILHFARALLAATPPTSKADTGEIPAGFALVPVDPDSLYTMEIALEKSLPRLGDQADHPHDFDRADWRRLDESDVFAHAWKAMLDAVSATPSTIKAELRHNQKIFTVDILRQPMREYAPGKWENCIWPSDSIKADAHQQNDLIQTVDRYLSAAYQAGMDGDEFDMLTPKREIAALAAIKAEPTASLRDIDFDGSDDPHAEPTGEQL